MKQMEVLDYALGHDCFLYEQRVKEDGIYYFVRKNGTKKLVVIFPVEGGGQYSIPAVCHVCQQLYIKAPEDIEPYCGIVKAAKERVKALENFPPTAMN
jgi:hypothetical protein